MAEPYYTTATALRSHLGVDSTTLTDARALVLIEAAEDQIDVLLGGWPVDEDTGRKVTSSDVYDWQWSKLGRATMLLAAHLYSTPGVFTERRFRKESGPDFAVEDPLTGPVPQSVAAVLNDSGLRRATGRSVHRRVVTRWNPDLWSPPEDQW